MEIFSLPGALPPGTYYKAVIPLQVCAKYTFCEYCVWQMGFVHLARPAPLSCHSLLSLLPNGK